MIETHARSSLDPLSRALARCRDDRVSGSLHLAGSPGGVFQLREGTLIAVESPGSPGTEALLLRSGRISEADWRAVLRTAPGPAARTELFERVGIGGTELRLIATMAAQDATFVIAAGQIEGASIVAEPVEVLFPVQEGIDLDWLLAETARRLDALEALPFPVAPHLVRVAPASEDAPAEGALSGPRREILTLANGRRSARDLAFLMGRNVFPVTVEVSRMLGEGLLRVVSGISLGTGPPLVAAVPRAPRKPSPLPPGDPHAPLPHRNPGASGAPEAKTPGWQVLPRLLSRIRASPQGSSHRTTSTENPNRKGKSRGP